MNPEEVKHWITLGLTTLTILVIGGTAVGYLLNYVQIHYNIWAAKREGIAKVIRQEFKGRADLAQAINEQQVQVAEAKGRLAAAELNKQAEIIDAQAVAQSVEIIGKSLHDNQGYLQWKWIHMMEENDAATIYVPTECNLPILESMRLNKPKS